MEGLLSVVARRSVQWAYTPSRKLAVARAMDGDVPSEDILCGI